MYIADINHNTPQQAPVITSHPQDVQILAGDHAILKVKADGTMPLRYQWYHESKKIHGMLNHIMHMPVSNLPYRCRQAILFYSPCN